MPKSWRRILERAEADAEKRMRWKEENPPVTLVTKEEADEKRHLINVGQVAVTCDLPCHGYRIPRDYGHTTEMVNVFHRGIIVEGWENPQEGEATYFGNICGLTENRICVARDEKLRKAIER